MPENICVYVFNLGHCLCGTTLSATKYPRRPVNSGGTHGNQLIAMQTLAAFIVVEISSIKPDLKQYLPWLGARLGGLADMSARASRQGTETLDYSSTEISETIEQVSVMIDAIWETKQP
ncbi:hypothetical protein ACQKP1_23285 [Allorhizobium sp. NPDC080224]|uniref:hypothetical protein n=1 Tax=Allorhizobium sp. NPDC080224 TaxID=3390547 RepID=UPI003D079C1C